MIIRVKVQTGTKKEVVKEITLGKFEVSVKAKPERNEANARVRELMASHFKVKPGKVVIIAGHHSPNKMLSIDQGKK